MMLNLVSRNNTPRTADCTFVLKRTVEYYRRNGSHVFAGFIDFNKDSVSVRSPRSDPIIIVLIKLLIV